MPNTATILPLVEAPEVREGKVVELPVVTIPENDRKLLDLLGEVYAELLFKEVDL